MLVVDGSPRTLVNMAAQDGDAPHTPDAAKLANMKEMLKLRAEEEALEGDLGATLGSRQPDVVGAACLDDDGTSLLRAAFPLGGGLGFGLGEPPRVAIDKINPVRGGAYVRSAGRTSAASRNRLHRFALEADETLVALERRKI